MKTFKKRKKVTGVRDLEKLKEQKNETEVVISKFQRGRKRKRGGRERQRKGIMT